LHGRSRSGNTNNITVLIDGTKEDQESYAKGVAAQAVGGLVIFLIWFLILLLLKCCGTKRVGLFAGVPPKRPQPPAGYMPEEAQEKSETGAEKSSMMKPIQEEEEEQYALEPNPSIEDSSLYTNTKEEGILQEEAPDPPDPPIESSAVEKPSQEAIDVWKQTCRRIERNVKWARIVSLIAGVFVIGFSISFLVRGVDALGQGVQDTQDGLVNIQDVSRLGILE
jgi:hypothetical protein